MSRSYIIESRDYLLKQGKKYEMIKLALNIILTIGLNLQLSSQVDKIITFNIRYDNPNDNIDQWNNRKSEIVEFIEYYQPDIFGIQEGLSHQVRYLDSNLYSYSWIGVGRDDGSNKGEFSAIFYKNEKLKFLKGSTFWLSEKSQEVSVGWDAAMERICTYGLFEDQTNKQRILIFNTHYDHIGEKAREKSSRLILEKIQEINVAKYPVVLMGDFNAEPHEKPIKIILNEFDHGTLVVKDDIYGPKGTFNGFDKTTVAERRIDYIFTQGISVQSYRHIDDKMKNGNFLSDHFPVIIEITEQ